MLDGAIKTIMVDDSKTVGELLVTICSRIGVELRALCFCIDKVSASERSYPMETQQVFLRSNSSFVSFFQRRHHKLRGVLANPGDGGGEEGRRDGNAEEGKDAAARRQEDGEAEGQAAHRR